MDTNKLKQIIDAKNERLEHDAINEAARVIDAIAREHQKITASNAEIVRLRSELRDLTVQQIDPAAILGA